MYCCMCEHMLIVVTSGRVGSTGLGDVPLLLSHEWQRRKRMTLSSSQSNSSWHHTSFKKSHYKGQHFHSSTRSKREQYLIVTSRLHLHVEAEEREGEKECLRFKTEDAADFISMHRFIGRSRVFAFRNRRCSRGEWTPLCWMRRMRRRVFAEGEDAAEVDEIRLVIDSRDVFDEEIRHVLKQKLQPRNRNYACVLKQ